MISILDMRRNIWIPSTITHKLQDKSYLVKTTNSVFYHLTWKYLHECQVHPHRANEMQTQPKTLSINAPGPIPQCNVIQHCISQTRQDNPWAMRPHCQLHNVHKKAQMTDTLTICMRFTKHVPLVDHR